MVPKQVCVERNILRKISQSVARWNLSDSDGLSESQDVSKSA
jgi:hypothetical protein